MLFLLKTAQWVQDETRHDLPATVPGWAIAYLALAGDWVGRERMAAVFWPDAAADEALHNLRVNLHRVRQLLAGWGVEAALGAERRRVRLDIPTDVALLRRALADGRWRDAQALCRQPLFDGMAFPGFPALQEWAELERADLHAALRTALLREARRPDVTAADALDATQALLAIDPLDEDALTTHLRVLAATGGEQHAAQRYAEFTRRLADDLGVAPSPALQRLAAQWPQRTAARGAGSAEPPARDAFIGRAVELEQVGAMLRQDDTGCITLLGPGGVGKSRLARELARVHGASLRDGATWVALEACATLDAALVELAAALGVALVPSQPLDALVARALEGARQLIVLDNAEQVPGLGGWLQGQAQAAPGVRWLVTSRAPLGLARERVYALEGLAFPAPDEHADAAHARAADALRFLDARVRALDPRFDLDAQFVACLELVRCVGGWPLALEVAASALAVQPAAVVLADLRQSLDTLAAARTPQHARHDSVRASLQLTWQLLDDAQRRTLSALSVFHGGCTRAAALAVTQADGRTFAALSDRVLVQATGAGRWALHPLVAQFAGERLADDAPACADARRRHAQHYLQHLQRVAASDQADAAAVAAAVQADFDNFVAAWHFAIDTRDTTALGAGVAAWTHFCNARGRARDVAALMQAALAVASRDAPVHARLLLALANTRYRAGVLDDAIALAQQAASDAERADDAVGRRAALNILALALVQQGRAAEARGHAEAALASARAAHADAEAAQLANTCAIAAKTVGDYPTAAALYEDAIAIHRRRGAFRGLAVTLNNLGNVWRALDRGDDAQRCFEECLRLCDQHAIASTRAYALGNLGLVAYTARRLDAARRYAERTLAEPAPEPPMTAAAHALLARIAVEQHRPGDAAASVAQMAQLARRLGMHLALMEAIHCHALVLAARGRRDAAAARLHFIAHHPRAAAQARADFEKSIAAMALTEAEAAAAANAASTLDFDVLADAAVEAAAPMEAPTGR